MNIPIVTRNPPIVAPLISPLGENEKAENQKAFNGKLSILRCAYERLSKLSTQSRTLQWRQRLSAAPHLDVEGKEGLREDEYG